MLEVVKQKSVLTTSQDLLVDTAPVGGAFAYTSITTDSCNNVIITYYDTLNKKLKLARCEQSCKSYFTSIEDDVNAQQLNGLSQSISQFAWSVMSHRVGLRESTRQWLYSRTATFLSPCLTKPRRPCHITTAWMPVARWLQRVHQRHSHPRPIQPFSLYHLQCRNRRVQRRHKEQLQNRHRNQVNPLTSHQVLCRSNFSTKETYIDFDVETIFQFHALVMFNVLTMTSALWTTAQQTVASINRGDSIVDEGNRPDDYLFLIRLCDDGNLCTRDSCSKGSCVYELISDSCGKPNLYKLCNILLWTLEQKTEAELEDCNSISNCASCSASNDCEWRQCRNKDQYKNVVSFSIENTTAILYHVDGQRFAFLKGATVPISFSHWSQPKLLQGNPSKKIAEFKIGKFVGCFVETKDSRVLLSVQLEFENCVPKKVRNPKVDDNSSLTYLYTLRLRPRREKMINSCARSLIANLPVKI